MVRECQVRVIGTERLQSNRQCLLGGRSRLVQALEIEQIDGDRVHARSDQRVGLTVCLPVDRENLLIQRQRFLQLFCSRINDSEAAQTVRDGDVVSAPGVFGGFELE